MCDVPFWCFVEGARSFLDDEEVVMVSSGPDTRHMHDKVGGQGGDGVC